MTRLISTALILLLFSTTGEGHEAKPTAMKPNGWSYPISCCSGIDCREVAEPKRVLETRNGYVVPSGELIPYGDKRIKDSPDGQMHWCTQQGKEDGKVICLFVPPRSY